jgi:hypothetical protein
MRRACPRGHDEPLKHRPLPLSVHDKAATFRRSNVVRFVGFKSEPITLQIPGDPPFGGRSRCSEQWTVTAVCRAIPRSPLPQQVRRCCRG